MSEQIPKSNTQNKLKQNLLRSLAILAQMQPLHENASNEEQKIYEQQVIKRVRYVVPILFFFLVAFALFSFYLGRFFPQKKIIDKIHAMHKDSSSDSVAKGDSNKIKFWTCSMHPQVKLPTNEAKCPLCFMDLIPVYEGDSDSADPKSLILNERESKLIQVETTPVEYLSLTHNVRMIGKIAYDETRVANITLWTPGNSRLNRMHVAFTGAKVEKGDPLLEVYSPDLIAAQGEYLSAYQSLKTADKSIITALKDNLQASKRKLLDLGMTDKQIKVLHKRSLPEQTTTIYSPVSGTVINKLANEGEWHSRGMAIYQIADLSQVWLKLDSYESDMMWIRYAQEVTFETEAYPGEIFKGRIAFIDPFLNEATRTIKLRVNVPNIHRKLRPGMFARATIHVRVAEGGEIFDETLLNKWICPIHPETIHDQSRKCEVTIGIGSNRKCQQDLVDAQSLRFSGENRTRSRVLAIPATAPLITGKRAVVYIEEKKHKYDNYGNIESTKYRYYGLEVKLGAKAGDYYVVLSGLEEGQHVVTNGAFKIDSALQIMAKPSMMTIAENKNEVVKNSDLDKKYWDKNAPYHQNFDKFLDAYLVMGETLAKDSIVGIFEQKKVMEETLLKINIENVPPDSKKILVKQMDFLRRILQEMHGEDIKQLRRDYLDLSNSVIGYLNYFGHLYKNNLYKVHCPMYRNDMGGSWIQSHTKVTNPYYGSEMLRCGDVEGTIIPLTQLEGKQND